MVAYTVCNTLIKDQLPQRLLNRQLLCLYVRMTSHDVTLTSILTFSCYGNIPMTSLVWEYGKQWLPCTTNFSMTLRIEILATEKSDFLKYIIILQSFNYERHTLKRTRKMWKFKCNQDFSYINLSISHRLHLFLLLFIYSNISS